MKQLFPLIVIIVLMPQYSTGFSRLHQVSNNGSKIVVGHTLTSPESKQALPKTPYLSQFQVPEKPRVVDFALHIKRDILIWDELEMDGARITACVLERKGRFVTLHLSGNDLQVSDIKKRVVLIIERGRLELSCGKRFPKFNKIDNADSYFFLTIKRFIVTGKNNIELGLKIIPGSIVVPIVDILVHSEAASESEIEKYKEIKFDDENSRYNLSEHARGSSRLSESSAILPYSSHLSLKNKQVFVEKGVQIGVNANMNVKLDSFRLTRLSGFKFQWDQKLEGTFSTNLHSSKILQNTGRSGSIARWFIPGLSFSINIPVAGTFEAGAFVGIDWISEIEIGAASNLRMKATYMKHERVTATLVPPGINAVNKQHGGSSGSVSITASRSKYFKMSGFFGLRPLIAVGITYKKKKILFKGWKPTSVTISKNVNGNVGADIGATINLRQKNPAYLPYKGPDKTVGICNMCHSVQGVVHFTGKSLSAQTVIGDTVISKRMIAKSLFKKKLGRLCLLKSVC